MEASEVEGQHQDLSHEQASHASLRQTAPARSSVLPSHHLSKQLIWMVASARWLSPLPTLHRDSPTRNGWTHVLQALLVRVHLHLGSEVPASSLPERVVETERVGRGRERDRGSGRRGVRCGDKGERGGLKERKHHVSQSQLTGGSSDDCKTPEERTMLEEEKKLGSG